MFAHSLLSWITFLPLAGAAVLLFIPRERKDDLRAAALAASGGVFLLSLLLLRRFEPIAGFQFVEDRAWLPDALGSRYHVGLDGISLFLVLLTTFLTPLCLLGAWRYIARRVKEFLIAMLVLETGMLGALVALDLVLFYVFWELMLIPMYLIIGVWGGERKVYAAVKFFLYTLVGSLLMFVAILVIYQRTGSFDLVALREGGLLLMDRGPLLVLGRAFSWESARLALFLAFALSFAIKVPVFPFHTWLPDAHTEAPTPGSVILAGVLLKLGTYGFVRFGLMLFPVEAARCAPAFLTLAVIGILYGAFMCWAQKDMKRLIAYSSVSHLGYVMLGLFSVQAATGLWSVKALSGAMYQMLGHGIATGGLFMLVGIMYERRHSRAIAAYGGLARVAPVLTVMFVIMTLASIGLPGTSGFVGEFLILLGAFEANPAYAIPATLGVVFGAVYMLRLVQQVFYGPVNPVLSGAAGGHDAAGLPAAGAAQDSSPFALSVSKGAHDAGSAHDPPGAWRFTDLSPREIAVMLPLAALVFVMGLAPQPLLSRMEPTLQRLADDCRRQTLAAGGRAEAYVVAGSGAGDHEGGPRDR